MKSATVFGAITDIYLSPTKALNGLKEAKGWSWAAFILVAGFMAASMFLFYHSADPQFLIDQQVALLDPNLSAQKLDEARKSIEIMSGSMAYASIGIVFLGFVVINAIAALYLYLISKMDPTSDRRYGDWYGLGIWASMPNVINSIGMIILIVTAKTDLLPISMQNYASINQLVLGLEPQNAFYTLTESLNVFMFWNIALTAIGLKCWTNFNMNKATFYACLPYILVYCIWFIIALI